MQRIPQIFSNGAIYFPEDSPFSVCNHAISEEDKDAKIIIRLHKGAANMWEITQHLRGIMTQDDIDTKLTFPSAREIPGREPKNFYKFAVEGEIGYLANIVTSLGGTLEHGKSYAADIEAGSSVAQAGRG